MAPNLPLVTGLLKSVPPSHADQLSQSLVEIFESFAQTPRLFRRACEVEVINLHPTKINDIFRGNSFTGKMMTAYVKLAGTDYAQLVLKPVLLPLLQLKTPLELDTGRMSKSSNLIQDLLQLRTNMQALQKLSKEIFQHLFISIPSMPNSFRLICRELQMTVTHHFRDKSHIVPTSFLFLRYLCPIIVSPHAFGIFPEPPSPHVSRTLVLLSKIINALASGVHFGAKEEYMTDMNPFLDEFRPMVVRYFEQVMALPGPSSAPTRKSSLIKILNPEDSQTFDDVGPVSYDLSTPSVMSHLHFLTSLTSDKFLHIGAALNILPPVPCESPAI
jgi:neurofibromin 1